MTNEQQPADQGRGVGELPDLPVMMVLGFSKSDGIVAITGYNADQMQEYARAAIAALSQPKGSQQECDNDRSHDRP